MSTTSPPTERQLVDRLFISLIPLLTAVDGANSVLGAVWLPNHYLRVYVAVREETVAVDFSLTDQNSSRLWAAWHMIGALRFVAAGKWTAASATEVSDPFALRVCNVSQAIAVGQLDWKLFSNELMVCDVARHVLADIFDLPPDSEVYESQMQEGFLPKAFLGFFLIKKDTLRMYFRKSGFPGIPCALGGSSIGFDVALRDHYGQVRTYPIFGGSQISALLGADSKDLPQMFPISSFDGICCRVFAAESV
jgi:hypothetical protein